jgi:radical SAM superfamily enzyme YgiQ (UPF0313 family)
MRLSIKGSKPGLLKMSLQSSIGPIRPPSEAYSLLVRVTKNCPWNRCEFCSVFKGQRFERRTVKDVKEDILAAKRIVEDVQSWADQSGYGLGYVARLNNIPWIQDGGVKSVFLQDSDSLIIGTESLVEILEFLRETFPTLERICSYARAKTIFRKRPEALRRLRKAGLSRIHIGMETGDDELLSYIRKGATSEEMVSSGRMAVDAGFEVSEYMMPGLGGREKWEPHARNSAKVLNAINPHFIRLRTFHLIEDSPMYERARRGEFHMQSIEGVLLEIQRFIEELDVTSELITSDYVYNYFIGEVDGKLPDDKANLLKSIDEALVWWRSKGEPKRSPFLGSLSPSNI